MSIALRRAQRLLYENPELGKDDKALKKLRQGDYVPEIFTYKGWVFHFTFKMPKTIEFNAIERRMLRHIASFYGAKVNPPYKKEGKVVGYGLSYHDKISNTTSGVAEVRKSEIQIYNSPGHGFRWSDELLEDLGEKLFDADNGYVSNRIRQRIDGLWGKRIPIKKVETFISIIGKKLELPFIEINNVKNWAYEKYRHIREAELLSMFAPIIMKKNLEKRFLEKEDNSEYINFKKLRSIVYKALAVHAYGTYSMSEGRSEVWDGYSPSRNAFNQFLNSPDSGYWNANDINEVLEKMPLPLKIVEFMRELYREAHTEDTILKLDEDRDRVLKVLKILTNIGLIKFNEPVPGYKYFWSVSDTPESEELYKRFLEFYSKSRKERGELIIENLLKENKNSLYIPALIKTLVLEGFSKEEVFFLMRQLQRKMDLSLVKHPYYKGRNEETGEEIFNDLNVVASGPLVNFSISPGSERGILELYEKEGYTGEIKNGEFLVRNSNRLKITNEIEWLKLLARLRRYKRENIYEWVRSKNGGSSPGAIYFVPIKPSHAMLFRRGKIATIRFLYKTSEHGYESLFLENVPPEVLNEAWGMLKELEKILQIHGELSF